MNAQTCTTLSIAVILAWASCAYADQTPSSSPRTKDRAANGARTALTHLGAALVEDSGGNVTEVNLARCKVTNAALVHLAELPKLRKLHLESTQVTDAGLRHLFELRELRLINLGNTLVSESGRRRLREKLPAATVFPLDLAAQPSLIIESPEARKSSRGGANTAAIRLFVEDRESIRRMPNVHLSDGHKALCRIAVGNQMPELSLEGPDGTSVSLTDHYGETLTVAFFWTANRYQARTQLLDMDADIVKPFSSRGVHVVGIVVGESTRETKRLLSDSRVTFPVVLDRDQSAFAKVGAEKLPRTYLLDGTGKVLWFDIEYSLSTRRELRQAILFQLTQR